MFRRVAVACAAVTLLATLAVSQQREGYLWVSCEHSPPYSLYRYNLKTDTIDMILTLSLLDARVYNNLAFDGTNMYVGTNASDLFAKVDPWTGKIRSVGSYFPAQPGLFYEDGAYNPETGTLWRAGNDLIETDTNGNVLNRWAFDGQIYGLTWAHGVLWMTDYSHFGYIKLDGSQATFVQVPITGAPALNVSLAYCPPQDRIYIASFIAATQSVDIYSLNLSTMRAEFVTNLNSLGYPYGFINPDALCWVPEKPEAWAARYDGPAGGDDTVHDMVVDEAGNAYVVGGSYGVGTNEDICVVKYSPDGQELWTARYDGPANGSDVGNGIALAPWGVAVTGRSDGVGAGWDIVTIAYDWNGNELWVRRFDGPNHSNDNGNDVTCDWAGSVFVAGYVVGPDGTNDYKILKYTTAGSLEWERDYGNGDRDVATDIALGPTGNVVVAGWSSSANGLDYFTIVHNAFGDYLWSARYDGPGHWDDVLKGMAVDGAGNVYVSGRSWGDGVSWDFGTVKYNAAGQEQWVRRINLYGGPDESIHLALAPNGVVVTGWSSPTNPDVLTARYDAAGDLLWYRMYKGPGDGYDRGYNVVSDAAGNVFVTGRSQGQLGPLDWDAVTIMYDPRGGMQWAHRYNGPGDADDSGDIIRLGPKRSVYVAGSSVGDGTGRDYVVMKYEWFRHKPTRDTKLPMGPFPPPGN